MLTNDFQIRRLGREDLSQVLSICAEAESGAFLADGRWGKDSIGEILGKGLSWGHFRGQSLSAFVLVEDREVALEVIYLATVPEALRQGLMKALLKHLQGLAQSQRKSLWLEVRVDNVPAQKLYRRLNFKRGEVRRGYYPDGKDALSMSFS